jgi:hypothetical protein
MRAKAKPRGRPFEKGHHSGRPPGALNKVTEAAREFATRLVEDPIYQAKLLEDLRERKLGPAMETLLWHYSKGKPHLTLNVETPGDVTFRIESNGDGSDDDA